MANSFLFNIDANDLASAKLEQVNKRINALKPRSDVIDATTKLAAMQKRVADASGLGRMVGAFNGLGRATLGVFQNVARIVTPLSAIAGAASAAGIYRLATAWADFGSHLGFAAQRIGITSDRLQSLQGAERLAGGSAEGLTSGLQNLGQTMFDAIGGRAPETVVMMNTLGVAFRDASGHARNVSDVLPELADKIASLKDPYAQARAAQALFGASAEEMLPFLRRGAAGIAELTEKAKRYGVTNEAGIAAANRLREAHTSLTLAVDGLGNSIAQGIEPALTPLITQFADWIAKNREWIATGITDAVKEFAGWVKSIDWQEVGRGVKEFGGDVQHVVDLFGGWKNVGEGLLIFMAGKWLIGMMAPIRRVGAALTGLAARQAAMGIGGGASLAPVAAVAGGLSLPGVLNEYFGVNAARQAAYAKVGQKPPAFPGFSSDKDDHGLVGTIQSGAAWIGNKIFGNDPRGIRNNNPLNLTYAGQAGTTGSDGRFGTYRTMEDGIAASERQLLRYQQRGLNSISQIVSAWAPSSENDTKSYIGDIAKQTGFDADKRLNMQDPTVAKAVIAAMGRHETGRDIDAGVVARGVSAALGETATPSFNIVTGEGMPKEKPLPYNIVTGEGMARGAPANIGDGTGSSGAPGAAGPSGQATITVRHVNPPPGSTISAATSGDVFAGAPRIEQAMTSSGP